MDVHHLHTAALNAIARTRKQHECPPTEGWIKMYVLPLLFDRKARLILCHPVDHNPPGSCVHGVSQEEHWTWTEEHSSATCRAVDGPAECQSLK